MQAEATYRGTVYPWQCDHIGHMNIMWYVGKFDEANWNLFARIGLTPSYLRDSGLGMAAVQQNIASKRELLAGDIVEVRSALLEVRDRSIRFKHEMRNAETGEIAAICEITGVHMDRQARKSTAFSDSIRFEGPRQSCSPFPSRRMRDVAIRAEKSRLSRGRCRNLRSAAGDAHARHFDCTA